MKPTGILAVPESSGSSDSSSGDLSMPGIRSFSAAGLGVDRLGDGSGYDILSHERPGEHRFIEVKTTNGGHASSFIISRNELDFAAEAGDAFHLYRVFSSGGTKALHPERAAGGPAAPGAHRFSGVVPAPGGLTRRVGRAKLPAALITGT